MGSAHVLRETYANHVPLKVACRGLVEETQAFDKLSGVARSQDMTESSLFLERRRKAVHDARASSAFFSISVPST